MLSASYLVIPEGIKYTGLWSLGFILLVMVFLFIRWLLTRKYIYKSDITWGCGYMGYAPKTQYTASSYIRTYRKLFEPALMIKKDADQGKGIYPVKIEQSTHPDDKIEFYLINIPVNLLKKFLNKFVFLQNGNIQSYILYGVLFLIIASIITLMMTDNLLMAGFIKLF